MAEADQKPSTLNLDFPLPLLQAVQWTTSQGFDLAEVWEAFEQALIWDRIHAWDPRREHFEGLVPYLQEFSQASTPPSDTDVIQDRGRIRGSTWRQWLADGSLNRETGTIARLFEGRRRPHVEVFEPVLEGADVRSVYSILSARRENHVKQPGAAAASLTTVAPTLTFAFTAQPAATPLAPEPAAPTLSIAATDLVAGSSASVEAQKVDPFRTHAPGRPTGAVDMVLREAARRINEGEVEPRRGVRQDFADILHDWWEIAREKYDPPGPRVTAKTIYGSLKDLWNEAIKNSQNTPPKIL
jgi:hypothetical protein